MKRLVAAATLLACLTSLAQDVDKPTVLVLEPGTVFIVGNDAYNLEVKAWLFPDPVFQELNTEVVRLQKAELSLRAENTNMRKALEEMPGRPSAAHVVIAVVVGLAIGAGATAYALTR